MFADLESGDEEAFKTKLTKNLDEERIRQMNDNEEMSDTEV